MNLYEKWTSKCGRVTLYRGDCLDVMPTFDADSVDSVICDPPYGIFFMGSKWDHGVPGVPFWEATKRVMKPGAMLLAFGGTRTFHRLTCAIEDAGLEIRDCFIYLYGSGFPKSHNISKGIDRAAGAERTVVGPRPRQEGMANRKKNIYKNSKEGYARPWMQDPEKLKLAHMQTAPATPDAQLWDGYGTALKPAFEPITLGMKPLDGTFAANALRHGVAGLNIDGARIEGAPPSVPQPIFKSPTGRIYNMKTGKGRNGEISQATGRWPANVILDEAAAAELDEQSGVLASGAVALRTNKQSTFNTCVGNIPLSNSMPASSGGASRFFYCAKPSKAERNAGLEGMEKKGRDSSRNALQPSMNGGEGNAYNRGVTPVQNHHPTVKPIALLRYLTRLTKTPTGGNVLDPFMGSGSTGCAAVLEGRAFIGIEKEPKYFEIAKRRIAHALAEAASDMFAEMEGIQ